MLTKTFATRFPFPTLIALTARTSGWLLVAYPTTVLWVWLTVQFGFLPRWTPIVGQAVTQVGLRVGARKNKRLPAVVLTFQRWCRFRRRLPALLAAIKGDTNPAYLIAAAPGSKRNTTAVANRLRPIGISPRFGRITAITPQAVTCTVRPAKGKTLNDLAEVCDVIAADDPHVHSIDVDFRRTTTSRGTFTVYFGEPFDQAVPINNPTTTTAASHLSLVTDERKPA